MLPAGDGAAIPVVSVNTDKAKAAIQEAAELIKALGLFARLQGNDVMIDAGLNQTDPQCLKMAMALKMPIRDHNRLGLPDNVGDQRS